MKIKRNQSGFTLIEVVLVLAIGGLIFLLAFLAFQQVSINRRDTARRSDLSRTAAELQNYAGDKNGAYPVDSTAFSSFFSNYMAGSKDPTSKAAYTPVTTLGTTPGNVLYTYFASAVTSGAKTSANTFCDGDTYVTAKSWKVEMKLEKGTACADSQ